MLKWTNVKELNDLGLEEEKLLGRMRLDWLGSRIDHVCNQWFPSPQFVEAMLQNNLSIQALQEVLNELIFNQLNSFDRVIEQCGGEGYCYEQLFKIQTQKFNFFIRLKPVKDDYSYIFVYYH